MHEESSQSKHERVDQNQELYFHADLILKKFSDKLLAYPPLSEIPTDGYFRTYLKKVTEVISALFPFRSMGIGKGAITDQIGNLLAVNKLPEKVQTLHSEHDCKIPAVVTAYYLQALAEQRGWPIRVESFILDNDPHAFIVVKLPQNSEEAEMLPFQYAPDECYIVDYQYIETKDVSYPGVLPHGEAEFEHLVEKGRLTRETNLEKGLMLYDGTYYNAGGE